MNYAEEWRAFSARIHGLVAAGQLHASFLSIKASDMYGRAKDLRAHSARMVLDLEEFSQRHQSVLPDLAKCALADFLVRAQKMVNPVNESSEALQQRTWAVLVSLSAFEAEFTHTLSNIQTTLMLTSERALIHLQRSIAVDSDVRKKWEKALSMGEVECEKLGSIHLLLHGIWAFKANASGARTDLVFQEPLNFAKPDFNSALGLVLTEWKVAKSVSIADRKYREAREQAERYTHTAFSGAELTSYRYAVVVSEEPMHPPADVIESGVTYRHVNIATAPRVPSSKQSKRHRASGQANTRG